MELATGTELNIHECHVATRCVAAVQCELLAAHRHLDRLLPEDHRGRFH